MRRAGGTVTVMDMSENGAVVSVLDEGEGVSPEGEGLSPIATAPAAGGGRGFWFGQPAGTPASRD